jgi:biopolymer transport protein ExbB/TolQ
MHEILGLFQFVIEGGAIAWMTVTMGLVGFAIAVERWVRINFTYSVNSRAFMAKLKKYILSDNIDRAISLCNSKTQALLPRVMKAGLTRAKDSDEEIQHAIEEATLECLPRLEERSLYLPVIANLATLMGLLGTIIGLILAFKASDALDAAARNAFLQKSIAMALNCTAIGVSVAIPALLTNALLQARVNAIISDIDQYSVKLVNLIAASKKAGSTGRSIAADDDDEDTGSKKRGKRRSKDDDEDDAAANDD